MNYSKKISVAAILTIAMLSSCIKDKDLSQLSASEVNVILPKRQCHVHRIR